MTPCGARACTGCPTCVREWARAARVDLLPWQLALVDQVFGDSAPPPNPPIVVSLPWKSPPLSLNDRLHWRPKAEKVKRARTDARWAIRAAKPRLPQLAAAEVSLHWRIPDRIRRDLDNLAATLKPAIDALVDEGVLPDDDWRHVHLASSRIHPPEPGRQAAMWLEVIPKEPL